MELGTYSEPQVELLPAAQRTLRLKDIVTEDKRPEFVQEGEDNQQWKWIFTVDDTNEDFGKEVFIWTNRTISKRSKSAPIIEAILGKPLDVGEVVNTEQLLGGLISCYLSDKREQGGAGYRIIDPKHVPQLDF